MSAYARGAVEAPKTRMKRSLTTDGAFRPVGPDDAFRRLIRRILGEKEVVIPHTSVWFVSLLDKKPRKRARSGNPPMIRGLCVNVTAPPKSGPDSCEGGYSAYERFIEKLFGELETFDPDQMFCGALRSQKVDKVVVKIEEYNGKAGRDITQSEFAVP